MPLLKGFEEAGLVGDNVIGRKHAEDCLRVLALDKERGQAAGGRSVAGHRLLDNLVLGHTLELVGDLVGEELVCNDPGVAEAGQGLQALNGLLNHGTFAIESQDLLGAGAAGTRPEPGTAAASQNHRSKIDSASS